MPPKKAPALKHWKQAPGIFGHGPTYEVGFHKVRGKVRYEMKVTMPKFFTLAQVKKFPLKKQTAYYRYLNAWITHYAKTKMRTYSHVLYHRVYTLWHKIDDYMY